MRFFVKTLFCPMLVCQLVQAQTEPVHAEPVSGEQTQAEELDKVVVKASSNRDERRESSAGKIVVSGEDLTRHGDTTVLDVLKRLPGITVSGAAGRGGEIRMRGLGSGYTLILLNGEPTAPGFSIDSIAPDLIDRIEISRAAMADKSAQAIAGSINIILKQVVRQAQRDLKAYAASEGGQAALSIGGQWADKASEVSYTLGAELRREQYRQVSTTWRQARDAQGVSRNESVTTSHSTPQMTSLSLSPRINWTPNAQDAWSAEGFLFRQRQENDWPEQVDATVGPAPVIARTDARSARDSRFARARLGWARKLADAAQIEVKLGGSLSERSQRSMQDSLDADGILQRQRTTDGPVRDQSVSLSGKYRVPFMVAHTVSLGWDGEQSRRTESWQQRDVVPGGLLVPANQDEAFQARVDRLALFIQDEWELGAHWSIYQGLRWESLDTRSQGLSFEAGGSQSRVFSPVVQSLWKVPGRESDQVRLALSRTYKAPSTRDLSPRRYVGSTENTPTSPDYAGNPALRPELAWGLDLAYERYLDKGSVLSASAFARGIDDVILRQVGFDAGQGLWVSRPVNAGQARTYGIELEAKGNARQWFKAAPQLDLRINLARNWSVVDSVPGPNNRLAQQTPLSANLGADWRWDSLPLTVGGNFGFMGAGPVAVSANQTAATSIKRQLDAYGSWKVDARTQWRLSLSNLLRQDQVDESQYLNTDGSTRQWSLTPTDMVVRLALEMKLAL